MSYLMLAGKKRDSTSIFALTAFAVANAFAFGDADREILHRNDIVTSRPAVPDAEPLDLEHAHRSMLAGIEGIAQSIPNHVEAQ